MLRISSTLLPLWQTYPVGYEARLLPGQALSVGVFSIAERHLSILSLRGGWVENQDPSLIALVSFSWSMDRTAIIALGT